MTLINLGYSPRSRYKWKELPLDFEEKEFGGKKVIKFHKKLWEQTRVIFDLRSKGWDSILLIDGRRRSGKSTLAMQIGYLLDPNLSIDNYVSGIEDSPKKIDKAKDESCLIFDEGSLVVGSKDAMSKQSKQLHKIIDVVGQKRLTLIFCMPSFTSISRQIVVDHSMFLIRVGVNRKTLARGHFKVFKNKRMKQLYDLTKKDPRLSKKVKHSFNGKFEDFHLPFEKQYFDLKKQSMQEAINPTSKGNPVLDLSKEKTKIMMNFRKECPEVTVKSIARGFGISTREFFRRQKLYNEKNG